MKPPDNKDLLTAQEQQNQNVKRTTTRRSSKAFTKKDAREAFLLRQKAAKTLLSKKWPQQKLLRPYDFCKMAQDRGWWWLKESDLENWDRVGVLHPILKTRMPSTVHLVAGFDAQGNPIPQKEPLNREPHEDEQWVRIWDSFFTYDEALSTYAEKFDDLVIVPDKENFVPWNEMTKDQITRGSILYHPYQIFRLIKVIEGMETTFHSSNFKGAAGLTNVFRQELKRALATLRKNEIHYLRHLILFLLLEDKYLPDIRGARHLRHIVRYAGNGDDSFFPEMQAAFNPHEALKESEFPIEKIRELRSGYAHQGHFCDPLSAWFVLARQVDPKRRASLRGKALIACDYYEIADILGGFLQELTGNRQPNTDAIFSNTFWQEQLYGIPYDQIDFKTGNILPQVVRHYGLDLRIKVLLLVEGPTEREFILTWCQKRGFSLEAAGIRLMSLDGVGDLANRAEEIVHNAIAEESAIVLCVDDEGDALNNLNRWKNSGLIEDIYDVSQLASQMTPVGALLWRPCFEDANFSLDELVDAWIMVSHEHHFTQTGKEWDKSIVDRNMIKQIVEKVKLEKCCPSWIKAMEITNKERRVQFPYSFYKPAIGRHLAAKFAQEDRPVIVWLEKIFQFAFLTNVYNLPGRRALG